MKIEIRKLKQWYYENADILQDLFQVWYRNLTKQGITFEVGNKNKLFNRWLRFVYIETDNPVIEDKCAPTPFMDVEEKTDTDDNQVDDDSPLIITRK